MRAIFISLFSFSVIISTGYAQRYQSPMSAGHPHGHKFQMQKKFEMLDLNNEQRDKIDATRYETRKKTIPIRADIELKRLELEKEMKAETPNRNKIMKMTKEISNLQLMIKQTGIDEILDIQATLTPEQREQLKMPMYKFKKESKHGMK